ncbi:MAG: hypothetical protein Q9165_002920 [Trypethelium subeluteriae]
MPRKLTWLLRLRAVDLQLYLEFRTLMNNVTIALPEDEASASDSEVIPYRSKAEEPAVEDESENEEPEEEGEEEGEDEYVVEKILSHQFGDNGIPYFEVKWQGYEKKTDRTWEPEENLDGAPEAFQEYLDSIGGRPVPGDDIKPKKGKRKQSAGTPAAEAKSGSGRGRKKAKVENGTSSSSLDRKGKGAQKWEPPKGTWEHEIMNIDCIEEEYDDESKENKRIGFVMWNNGKKSKHSLNILNGKCPQKVRLILRISPDADIPLIMITIQLLQYYEQHLVFRSSSSKTSAKASAPGPSTEEGNGAVDVPTPEDD